MRRKEESEAGYAPKSISIQHRIIPNDRESLGRKKES